MQTRIALVPFALSLLVACGPADESSESTDGSSEAATPGAGDIVLYASHASVVHGNWQVVSDATAAGGARIWNPDQGAAKIGTALASPTSYFELTFNAPAATPYHVWVRMKAQSDSYANDSIHVQYSDAVNAQNAAVARIGTTSSDAMVLAGCDGVSDHGWGWTDAGWCGLAQNIRFASSGSHKIRIQQREDGASVDQVLLSPSKYLSSAPGLQKDDTTIFSIPSAIPGLTKHVVFVVLENHSYESVIGSPYMPYLNGLANTWALAQNYYANTHPSAPNYWMLTTGQTTVYSGTTTINNVVRQLLGAGKTWHAYVANPPTSVAPFGHFSDVASSSTQLANFKYESSLDGDVQNGVFMNYTFIHPGLTESGHSCPVSPAPADCDPLQLQAADDWLKAHVDPIIKSPAIQNDGLVVILFDESYFTDTRHGGGRVAVVFVGPHVKKGFRSQTFYQDESVLNLSLRQLGVPAGAYPGASAGAPVMDEFFY